MIRVKLSLMKVIITGASGMVGKGVLLECLDHTEVTKVLVIVRRTLDMVHPKLEQLVLEDFGDYSHVLETLAGYDACYLCMGVSAAGLSEEDYTTITYDYTLSLAKALVVDHPEMTCIYVSGEGTDSSEKGRSMWARVKGKTENDLLKLGFAKAFMFRPGAIIPERGIKSRTKLYQFVYDYFLWLVKLIRLLSPKSVVTTTQIGLAMIEVTRHGYSESVLRPGDILAAAAMIAKNETDKAS